MVFPRGEIRRGDLLRVRRSRCKPSGRDARRVCLLISQSGRCSLLCTWCSYCLQPRFESLGELFSSYDLTAPGQVRVPEQLGPGPGPVIAIRDRRVIDGWQCPTCVEGLTRDLETMKLHVSKAHQQQPSLYARASCSPSPGITHPAAMERLP